MLGLVTLLTPSKMSENALMACRTSIVLMIDFLSEKKYMSSSEYFLIWWFSTLHSISADASSSLEFS